MDGEGSNEKLNTAFVADGENDGISDTSNVTVGQTNSELNATCKTDCDTKYSMEGGRRHKGSKKTRKGNNMLKSWVAFVKKVQHEEKISYSDAMKRASKRKSEWKRGQMGGSGATPTPYPPPKATMSGGWFNAPAATMGGSNPGPPPHYAGGRRTKRRGTKKRRGSRRR